MAKYMDITILAEWLEKRAEEEVFDYRTRVGYELAAAEIAVIGEHILPDSDPLSTDIIHSPEDLERFFQKSEEDHPYIPTAEEVRKNRIGKIVEKTSYCILAGFVLVLLLLKLLSVVA